MVRKNLSNIHWTRFESWVNQGVPDLHGICDGINIFVELKVTSSNKINISPFQKVWNIKHTLHGGRSFIMLQHLSQRALYIFPCSVLHSTLSITPATAPQYRVALPAPPAAWACQSTSISRNQAFLLPSGILVRSAPGVAGATASPFHCQRPVTRGTIVVVSRSGDPGAEVLVDKLCDLALDYRIRWDYIHTCGYRIRLEVS